jgi:opacity protein-like surface antigen
MPPRPLRWAVLLVVALVFGLASTASAQTQVTVTRDNAIIWGREARVPITTVKRGTILEVVGQEGRGWYVVRVPPESGGKGELGVIAATQVEAVAGAPLPRSQSPANPPGTGRAPAGSSSVSQRAKPPSSTEILGFGQLGYNAFVAQNSFKAVFGNSVAPALGGGVRLNLLGRLFVEGSLDWMTKTGQRVVVVGGETFRLGITDRMRLLPVSMNVGYRHQGRNVTPYFGGGVGVVWYHETYQFADPSENISDRSTSYQGIVGFEVASPRSAVRTALEVQVSTVPKGLGQSGASAAFNEHNLGGVQARIKFLAGRKRD